MAKQIVSVCIFCFLCATHSPCASHVDVNHGGTQQYNENDLTIKTGGRPLIPYRTNANNESQIHGTIGRTSKKFRFKKEISKSHTIKDFVEMSGDHLEKLFYLYGDGKSINIEAFQKLMKRLDLIEELSTKLNNPLLMDKAHNHNTSECVDRNQVYARLKNDINVNETGVINSTVLKEVCPTLLYSFMAEGCTSDYDSSHNNMEEDTMITKASQLHAWFFSLIAVTIISVCGVLGLAVIPIMQKTFYQPLLQFLVALAVGTLAGDALLHLLPHAMTSHSENRHHDKESKSVDQGNHDENMWKGFVAMLGLIFFFVMERIIMLVAKWRKKKQLKNKLPSKLNIIKPEVSTQLTNAVDKQCKHKYSSFPYCYDEIKTDPDGAREDHVFQVTETGDNWESHNNTASTGLDELGKHSEMQSYHVGQNQEKNQNLTECPNEDININCSEINKMISTEINKMFDGEAKEDNDSIEYTVILREHDNTHHGHSHTHGHVHAAPKTMSSVAWMVIMGDGLHNFTDGMAIGAAFASDTAGGFSTAVAVFCHELPHELGDFAMLLKAGMSMKQALFYNLLSSILCLFGNIFGLWVGNTEHASSWIFAAAAGMFLYIALVDMIPELTSGHEAQGTLLQCVLHLGGLLLGFGIMALIALYEHDLKSIFHET